ncbi:hypothetical protein ACH4S8_17535 [Streptomyces sp. NPDC021080]|uniref:hypothetical protein n=1 Tax=Streptomyces sp. NPDC021080 TaxID=3365110 RepID=UPI00379CCCD4
MHWYLVGSAALLVAAHAGLGIVAVTTGWVPPSFRRRVARPRLFGWSALAGAAGLGLFMFPGPFHGHDAALTPTALVGILLFVASTVLQVMSQRPGGRGPAPADTGTG